MITGFGCHEQDFPAEGPVVPSGVHINVMSAYDSVRRVQEIVDILLPLHDLSIGRRRNFPD